MFELVDVQCFRKLTSSSTAVKNQKLMKYVETLSREFPAADIFRYYVLTFILDLY